MIFAQPFQIFHDARAAGIVKENDVMAIAQKAVRYIASDKPKTTRDKRSHETVP